MYINPNPKADHYLGFSINRKQVHEEVDFIINELNNADFEIEDQTKEKIVKRKNSYFVILLKNNYAWANHVSYVKEMYCDFSAKKIEVKEIMHKMQNNPGLKLSDAIKSVEEEKTLKSIEEERIWENYIAKKYENNYER